ncbi:CLUMA_CG007678, isoform B [Clunio marinus]|uniref:CLUMA_CG007678, isoform B n=1 Tax=Clunio marinus TaxID=568069 RepID=A0A1J1I6W5_9DIPT|nr:CLUMA_CG007678, isoform B [Clunio marinus]
MNKAVVVLSLVNKSKMEKAELPNHLKEAIKIFSEKNGFVNAEYNFSEGFDKGFIGLIRKCRIDDSKSSLSIVCKFLPDDDHHNKKYNSYKLFQREVYVYERILPSMEKLQLLYGLKYKDNQGFWAYPKCYQAKYDHENPANSFILMENLSEENFIMKDKSIPSDFNHTHALLVQLGKLHALSFALRKENPEIFEEYKKLGDLMCLLMTTPFMRHLSPRDVQLASELFNNPDEYEIRDKVLAYKDDLWERTQKTLEGSLVEPFGVICHGDCWINNVLYNYHDEEMKNIKSLRLIDWQQTRYGSGASELMYYLFTCNDKKLRDEHMEDLLESYHMSMRNMLKNFNLNIDEVFPFTKLKEHLKLFVTFALAMTTFGFPIDCEYPEKLFKDKNAELTENEKERVLRYNKRMKETIYDLNAMRLL